MPYHIMLHTPDLLWVVLQGHIELDTAESYFRETWHLLDRCPRPTDVLIDGRTLDRASPAARRRSDQVMHHPHLGHLAFVMRPHHLQSFAPFMHLISGIGLFGDVQAALEFLRRTRGRTPVIAPTLAGMLDHAVGKEFMPPAIPHIAPRQGRYTASLSLPRLPVTERASFVPPAAAEDDVPPHPPPLDLSLAGMAHTMRRFNDAVNDLNRTIDTLTNTLDRMRKR